MNDTREIDYEDFLFELFKNDPKPRNSIVLDLDTDNLKSVFEKLISIFHEATIYFHGDETNKVDLSKLTIDDMCKINKYFHSFNINLNFRLVNKYEFENYKKYIIGMESDFKLNKSKTTDDRYNKPELKFYYDYKWFKHDILEDRIFKILINDTWYIIWFNFL
jgi:hypothetical protein